MPKGYVIFTEDVHDQAGMGAYSGKAIPTLMSSGGNVLALGDGSDVLEGEWHGNQSLILEFESVEAAKAWYNSPEYQEAIPLRQAAGYGPLAGSGAMVGLSGTFGKSPSAHSGPSTRNAPGRTVALNVPAPDTTSPSTSMGSAGSVWTAMSCPRSSSTGCGSGSNRER